MYMALHLLLLDHLCIGYLRSDTNNAKLSYRRVAIREIKVVGVKQIRNIVKAYFGINVIGLYNVN